MTFDQRAGHALSLMKEALHLLDGADVAPDVGAHLDLAINRLTDKMRSQSGPFGNVLAAFHEPAEFKSARLLPK